MCVCLSDQCLNVQGVKNHSKVMVLRVSDAELRRQMAEEEEKNMNQSESIQRTKKGFQILSERGGNMCLCLIHRADGGDSLKEILVKTNRRRN